MKLELGKYYIVQDVDEVIEMGENPIVLIVEKDTLSSERDFPFVCDLGGVYNEQGYKHQGWDEFGDSNEYDENDPENLERESTFEEYELYYHLGRQ